MKKILLILIAQIMLFSTTLKELDSQRVSIEEGVIDIVVTTIKKSGKTTTKRYTVLRKDKSNSLVIFKNDNERGTIVLKEQNNLYIKTGRSQRAIRISPIQRLIGDISIGDILEIKFNENYKIVSQKGDILFLKAIDKKSTYATIKVYTKNSKLIKADLFSYSKKKLKTIYYLSQSSSKINKYKFVSQKGESIVTITRYKKFNFPKKLFRKINIKELYQMSKKYTKE